jgi:hypothetical protein
MVEWLYNSKGCPIAFVSGQCVYSKRKRYVGILQGNIVWHGSYLGEIIYGERFLYDTSKSSLRGPRPPSSRPSVPSPQSPSTKGEISLPSGFRDVKLE